MGFDMPRSIRCARLRLDINDVRWKDPRIARNCLFAWLVFVFRLPRAPQSTQLTN